MASSATVGTAVIKLSFDGKSVQAELNGVSKKLETNGKTTGGKWGTAWVVAAGGLISKGISKITSSISSSMSSAIGRMDSLNNFPTVMTALGYSAEEASKSVDQIGEALDGLPTSLDAAVGDIQKLAATMGNLADGEVNATSVGLALNNMFLAGGKGTAIASAAMEQYNQMLAAGKVDMQAWRSMVNAAPGQMDQLAKSILGATANQGDLYEAMRKGKVSFDDFNAAVVKLNNEGGEGFASFYDQAVAATGGVATQLENVKNTINKIIASALSGDVESMDKYTNQLISRVTAVAPTLIWGFADGFAAVARAMPDIIKSLVPSIMDAMNIIVGVIIEVIPELLKALADSLPDILKGIQDLIIGIAESLPARLNTIMEALSTFLQQIILAIPQMIPQLIEGITNGIITLAQTLTDPQFLTLLLRAALTLFMSIVHALPEMLTALINALPQIIDNIITFLTSPDTIQQLIEAAIELFFALVLAVPQILGALIQAFGNLVASLWNGITSLFGEFAANFGNFIGDIFKGAINGVISFIEGFVNLPIDALNGFIGIINGAFGWIGVNLGYIDRIQLPRLAEGGVADSATTAIIGEEGKEAVIPLENNTDNWAGLLAATLVDEFEESDRQLNTGGVTVYMTNQISNEMDAEDIGRILMQSIRRAA